jgi:inner membrane protein
MPTILSHAVVPLALGLGLGDRIISRRLLVAGSIASMLPDLDVLAFRFNVAYADSFGHRGASHSIAFAILLALLAAMCSRRLQSGSRIAFLFVGVSAASHGLLDMLTNGGHGVALWWPVSANRYFAPWQVIEVSPLSLRRVFGGKGLEVLQSEFLWIWLPALLVFVVLFVLRRDFIDRFIEIPKPENRPTR